MCSPRKSNENFSIFTFYESKQMSLTQDLRWSLGRSIALQLQRQTNLLLCTINCFLQWDHLPNMAVGDLAFYYIYIYGVGTHHGKFLLLFARRCVCASWFVQGPCFWNSRNISYTSSSKKPLDIAVVHSSQSIPFLHLCCHCCHPVYTDDSIKNASPIY